MVLIFYLSLGFILVSLLFYCFKKYSSKYFLDKPNSRSSHTKPIPRGAGIVFSTFTSFLSLLFLESKIYFAYPLSIVGFIDDKYSIPSWIRFLSQFFTSFFILYNSIFFIEFLNPSIIISTIFFTVLGIAIINFTNFLDCLDGLITSVFMIIFATIALENQSYLPLVISLLSFLLLNWHPAKLFMGDSGSTYIGAVFFYTLLQTNDPKVFMGRLLLASPIYLDALTCLLSRFRNNFNIFRAHRMHLAQRLYQAGWSHSKVAKLYIFFTLINSLIYIFGNLNEMYFFTLFILFFGFYIDKKYAKDFLSC